MLSNTAIALKLVERLQANEIKQVSKHVTRLRHSKPAVRRLTIIDPKSRRIGKLPCKPCCLTLVGFSCAAPADCKSSFTRCSLIADLHQPDLRTLLVPPAVPLCAISAVRFGTVAMQSHCTNQLGKQKRRMLPSFVCR